MSLVSITAHVPRELARALNDLALAETRRRDEAVSVAALVGELVQQGLECRRLHAGVGGTHGR